MFDSAEDELSVIPDMKKPCDSSALYVIGNKLYVIGGAYCFG